MFLDHAPGVRQMRGYDVGVKGRTRRVGPGSPTSLGDANKDRVLGALRLAGTLTQAEIARATGLAPSTVSKIVAELTGSLLVVSEARVNGRASKAVRLARAGGVLVGIEFGHRHLRVGVADPGYSVLAEERVALEPGHRAADGLTESARTMDELLARTGTDRADILGIGLGLPAPIDSRTGMVGAPSILPGWVEVDARAVASDHFGIRVLVDNDANLGALAESRWGAGRGAEIVAYLKLSDGVGAGVVIGGELYRGGSGTAGEIGHTTINEFGRVCRCGNRGCLESFVSTRAVLDLLTHSLGPDITIADVVDRAQGGDVGARRVLADTGHYVGVGVSNLCNVMNPDRIVIGGELAQAGELILGPVRHALDRYAIPSAVSTLELVVAELGARAQLLGALALASVPATGPFLQSTLERSP